MIQDSHQFYQKRLAISVEEINRIEQLILLIQRLDSNFQPDTYFISDYLIGEEREWKHLYIFSIQKMWIAHKFQSVVELESIPFVNQDTYPVQISAKSFDMVTYNEKSRFSATIQIEKNQIELKATQANCMVLLDVLRRFFIQPNVV